MASDAVHVHLRVPWFACLSVLRLAELAREVGFPPGAINMVPGRGKTAGAALSAHPGINFVSFTGSPEVGTLVRVALARHHRGCTLELGGKSPQIVFADADLYAAVPAIGPLPREGSRGA